MYTVYAYMIYIYIYVYKIVISSILYCKGFHGLGCQTMEDFTLPCLDQTIAHPTADLKEFGMLIHPKPMGFSIIMFCLSIRIPSGIFLHIEDHHL